MILLIPLSRFRITYEAGCGRPYSQLESLILKAVENDVSTLDKLHDTFGIHRRLLIEALVTLTQAGWLAVSSDPGKSFVLTLEGRQAMASGDRPRSLLILPKEWHVLMERLTGALLSSRDVNCVSERELEEVKAQFVRIPPQMSDQDVDGSTVQHLLPRAQGEWIRWIGPIDLISRDFQWFPVTVDLKTGAISALPDEWRHLRNILLEEVARRARTMSTVARSAVWSRHSPKQPIEPDDTRSLIPEWQVSLAAQDFLYDRPSHERYLREILQIATSSVFKQRSLWATLHGDVLCDRSTPHFR